MTKKKKKSKKIIRKTTPVKSSKNNISDWIRYSKFSFLFVLLVIAILIIPGSISVTGINFIRLIFTIFIVFFLPGILLLPLIDKEIELDWLETIPLLFSLGFAFITIPLLIGFFVHLSFVAKTYFALALIFILIISKFALEERGIVEPLSLNRKFSVPSIIISAIVLVSVFFVTRLGAEMATIGDNKVHLARIRRILEMPILSPQALEPFKDGGLHPGYAYPAWHLIQAFISKLSGIDPVLIWYYLNTLLTIISIITIYFFIKVLFQNRALAAFAVTLYLLPSIFSGGSGTLMLQRLLVHPSEISFLFFLFLIPALFIVFIRKKGFSIPLFILIFMLSLDLAFIHLADLTFLVAVYVGFFAILVLTQVRNKEVLIKAGAILSLFVVAGLLYYLNVSEEVSTIGEGLGRYFNSYLEDGTLVDLGNGRIIPPPIRLLPMLLPLLIAGLLTPLVKKRIGLAFLYANILVIIIVLANPIIFMKFSETITYIQSRRFHEHTTLLWLLTSLLLFTGLSYLSGKAEELIGKEREPIDIVKATLIIVVPVAIYFIGWPIVSKSFNSLDNDIALILAAVSSLSVIGLIVLSTKYRLFSEDKLEDSLDKSPHALALVIFFVFYVIFTPLKIAPLQNQILDGSVFPRDPLSIQGNSYMVSHELIKEIRESVPEDAVILSDHQTSEVLAAFVPRYVATFPSGHQSSTQVGVDTAEHLMSTVSFFETSSDADKRSSIIRDYNIDYVLVNRRNFARFELQSENLLDKTRVIYDDGNFTLYKVTDLRQ